MSNQIHATAVVSKGANLGGGNSIGPYVVIEDNVKLGDNNHIGAHCVIKVGSRIGNNNTLHEQVVYGGPPQDLSFEQKVGTFAQMGNGNVLREFVTVHRATTKESGYTRIGDDNYFMATSHIAHDCQIGNNIIMANDAVLAGHVRIGDRAFISGGVKIHQFTQIGTYAMIGGNSKITQDCLPYMITDGMPGRVRGLNLVGLKRAGFSMQDIRELKEAYSILFSSNRSLEIILNELESLGSVHANQLVAFIRNSKRKFHRADRQASQSAGSIV